MNIKDIESRLLEGKLNVRFHNGVGFMQAYLTEDVRLHVWHPELIVPLESFGNRHNHRFNLESYILMGSVVDTQFEAIPGEGPFDVYTVMPAHFGKAPEPILIQVGINFAISSIKKYEAGEDYQVKKRIFHESRADGLTVTVVKKFNQDQEWASILATSEQRPEHAMSRKPAQSLLNQLFFSALRRLPIEANKIINDLT